VGTNVEDLPMGKAVSANEVAIAVEDTEGGKDAWHRCCSGFYTSTKVLGIVTMQIRVLFRTRFAKV
jgi:hypothetical protein